MMKTGKNKRLLASILAASVDFQCDPVPAQRRGKAGIGCGICAG